jgi:hypothetical protein
MLTSLSAKLAILGPPTLLAEIPEDNTRARALFGACGWQEERTYADLTWASPAARPAPPGLVVPVTVEDLGELALPQASAPRSWERSRGTLLNRRERLSALAIASGERLDASVIYSREDEDVALWSLSAAPGAGGGAALATLLGDLAHREAGRLVAPRLHADEVPIDLLSLGFTRGGRTVGLAATAKAA